MPSLVHNSIKIGFFILALLITQNSAFGQTNIIKDIDAGNDDSYPNYLVGVGDKLFFTADKESQYEELWVTDGTPDGTVRISDVDESHYASPDVESFVGLNGKVLFSGYNETIGRELYISDGTEAGTELLKNIAESDFSSDPDYFVVLGDRAFFAAEDASYPYGDNGDELWVTDGTTEGTRLFKDLDPGQHTYQGYGGVTDTTNNDGRPRDLFAYDGKIYFTASNAEEGREPWVSDGTVDGTFMLKDIAPGKGEYDNPFYSEADQFFGFNGLVIFTAKDTTSDNRQLWVTDGTTEGTQKIQQFGTTLGITREPAVYNGVCYFFHDRDLWKTDGTESGTSVAVDLPLPSYSDLKSGLIPYDGYLYFFGSYGLWRTDGTTGGTEKVFEDNVFNSPSESVVFKDKIYFTATDYYRGTEPGRFGMELWMTDGTLEGTMVVKDVYPGTFWQGTQNNGGNRANPTDLTVVGDNLYFVAENAEFGEEVWVTGGLPERTVTIEADSLVPAEFPDLDVTVEFSDIDTTVEVSALRDFDRSDTELTLPDGWELAMKGYWQMSLDTTVNFQGEVCFDLSALTNPSINHDQLGVLKRAAEGEEWTEQTVTLTQDTDGNDFICATGIQSFSEFVVVSDNQATAIEREQGENPLTFSLKPAYPNPFNPSTTIRYSLPEAEKVKLEVFDMLGRHMATLVDHRQNPGTYAIAFDASQFASGTYIYRLTAGEQVRTQKMTLLK